LSKIPTLINELVEKFERNLDAYKNSSYKEEQLKQKFINPFFKALGWDVDNVSGAAPQYRDVIFEDSIKVTGGKAPKAPDYCFTLTGRKMFFVEAKKPSVDINTNKEASYQLRRTLGVLSYHYPFLLILRNLQFMSRVLDQNHMIIPM
jgi:hypothetical protein